MKSNFDLEIKSLQQKGRYREVFESKRLADNIVEKAGKRLVSFSCNDYLSLSHNPQIIAAAQNAMLKYGTGGGASRLITGNNALYNQLESAIAKLHNSQAATIFSSGYTANIGTIGAIASKNDLLIIDKLAHSCLLEGAQLSGAEIKRFKHNDYEHLESILQQNTEFMGQKIIITEAVFSMDGDRANLSKLRAIAKKRKALLYIDYAHDIEFLNHANSLELNEFEIKMGTFSKAFAGLGGYIAGSKNLIKLMNSKAKSLIFSTALPPSVLAGNLAAIQLINSAPQITEQSQKNAQYFYQQVKSKLPNQNIPKPQSQIIPLIIGDTQKTIDLSHKLESSGFLVHPIKPPTVREGTSRLRFSFSATHTEAQINSLVNALISHI